MGELVDTSPPTPKQVQDLISICTGEAGFMKAHPRKEKTYYRTLDAFQLASTSPEEVDFVRQYTDVDDPTYIHRKISWLVRRCDSYGEQLFADGNIRTYVAQKAWSLVLWDVSGIRDKETGYESLARTTYRFKWNSEEVVHARKTYYLGGYGIYMASSDLGDEILNFSMPDDAHSILAADIDLQQLSAEELSYDMTKIQQTVRDMATSVRV